MEGDPLKKSRGFYRVFCPVLLAMAGLSAFFRHPTRACVLAGISVFLLTLHLVLPHLSAKLFEAYAGLMAKVGAFLTRAFITLFFYVIFTPYGLMVRAFQGDPLKRKIDKSAGSYWAPKSDADNAAERCERPF